MHTYRSNQRRSKRPFLWLVISILLTPMILASPAQFKGVNVTALPDASQSDFEVGFAALAHNKYMSANRLFSHITEQQPNNPLGWLALSFAPTSAEQFSQAVKKAKSLSPKATDDEKLLIDIQYSYITGDSDKRVKLVNELQKNNNDSSFSWWMKGQVLTDAKRNEEARDAFVKAHKLDNSHVLPLIDLGNNYLFNEPRNFVKAEKTFKKVTEIQPANAFAHIGLGDALRAQQQLEQAKIHYTRASLVEPTFGTAFTKKGHVNTFLGNYDDAVADYTKAIKVAEPENAIFLGNYKAFTHLYQDKPNDSISELNNWLKEIDAMPIKTHQKVQGKIFTLTNLAMIQLHNDMTKMAEETLSQREALIERQITEVDDKLFNRQQRANNQFWRGYLQARQGNLTAATNTADKMYQLLIPINDGRKYEGYHELMGFISLRSEKWNNAVAHYGKANQEKVYVKYHKALALEQSGDKKEAHKLFTDVKQHNFNSVDYALVRADAIEKSRFLTALAGL